MNFIKKNIRRIAAMLLASALAATVTVQDVSAEIVAPGSFEKLRQETVMKVRARMTPLLEQYCRDACYVVDIGVEVDEKISDTDDLGFEGISGEDQGENLFISGIAVKLQVDDRVTTVNRERLTTILKNNLLNVGTAVEIDWLPVTLPQIGQSAAKEEQLKRSIQQKITAAIDKVIDAYCPEQCVLSQVAVDGKLVTPDEAIEVSPEELVRDKSGQAILRIEGIDVEVGMDQSLAADTRKKIQNVMKVRTRFASPVNFDVQVSAFPESWARKQERERSASEDPFGLSRLRETLRIFRELAGTKEIITTNTSRDSNVQTSSESSRAESSSNARQTEEQGADTLEWMLYAAALLVLAGLIFIMVMRLTQASRDARMMMQAAQDGTAPARAGAAAGSNEIVVRREGATVGLLSDEQRKDLALRMKNEELRAELVKIFFDAPRVAKETFSRLLQEEGVEETARYVHIFGHMVIFELLDDPNLQRDLYELSEYYHKSDFQFAPEEENRLLNALRTRVTANEIRVLTRRQMEMFDFLTKLDATQIYNLIQDEKAQVQSIVLTQLDHKRRRSIFDMYRGDAKVELMRELCRADAIPKDYLVNVARALSKKVVSRPEFDTENLRSSDILLDLLEKADLAEQRALMQNLMATNQDAARGIKLKLVTVEIMPYLKDGHLLEIIMGMERSDLLTFLAGTREHIRDLLLHKAPDELSESWIEDLNNVRSLDEQAYRLIEMKVLGRIRSLANNGIINLLDINDMVFGKGERDAAADDKSEDVVMPADNAMVA